MPPIAILDACVLHSASVRDLLLRLAAAIRARADIIVTFNLSDFPRGELSRFGVEARHPDVFVKGLLDAHPDAVCTTVREQAASLRNPPVATS